MRKMIFVVHHVKWILLDPSPSATSRYLESLSLSINRFLLFWYNVVIYSLFCFHMIAPLNRAQMLDLLINQRSPNGAKYMP